MLTHMMAHLNFTFENAPIYITADHSQHDPNLTWSPVSENTSATEDTVADVLANAPANASPEPSSPGSEASFDVPEIDSDPEEAEPTRGPLSPEAPSPEPSAASLIERLQIRIQVSTTRTQEHCQPPLIKVPVRLLAAFTEIEECPIALTSPREAHRTLLGDTSLVPSFPSLCVAKLPCGHEFAAAPLFFYFYQNNMQCPMCRAGPKGHMSLDCFPGEVTRKFILHKQRINMEHKITSLMRVTEQLYNFMQQSRSRPQSDPHRQPPRNADSDLNRSNIQQSLAFYSQAMSESFNLEQLCFQYLRMKLKMQIVVQSVKAGKTTNCMQIMVPIFPGNEGVPIVPEPELLTPQNLTIPFAMATRDLARLNQAVHASETSIIRFEILKGSDGSWFNIIDRTEERWMGTQGRSQTLFQNSASSVQFTQRRCSINSIVVNLNFFYLLKEATNMHPGDSWEHTQVLT